MLDLNVNALKAMLIDGTPAQSAQPGGGGTINPASTPATSMNGTTSGVNVKKWLWILGFVFIALAAFGQTTNTFYARNFPGSTVGVKVTNAQAACNSDSAVPCIIVIDPSLAAYPTGTMPTKCSQCVWWDYRTDGGIEGLAAVTGISPVNCTTTGDDVSCSLDEDLPADETIGGDTIATEQWVNNQTSTFFGIKYGVATSIAVSGENVITFGSAPIAGSVDLWQGDTLVSPSDYAVSGDTLILDGYTFDQGAQISAFWQTQATTPGGIALSASAIQSAQIRQTIEAHVNVSVGGLTAENVNLTIPPDTQPGDFLMIAFTSDGANGEEEVTPPSGWNVACNATIAGGQVCLYYGIASSTDVESGYETFSYHILSGSYTAIDFAGPTGGIRETENNESLGTGGTVPTSSSVIEGDTLLEIGSSASDNTVTIGAGTVWESFSGVPSQTVALEPVATGGIQNVTFAFQNNVAYNTGFVVVIESGTTAVLGTEPANEVLAGPASGSAALPAYRKLTAADLPTGLDLSTTPDTVTPATFPSLQSASTTTGCTTGTSSYDVCTMSVTWPKAFSDSTYQVECIGIGPTDSGNPTSGRAVENGVTAQTTTGVTVQFATQGANAITFTGMQCIAMQNAGQ